MLCDILNIDRVRVYTLFEKPLSEEELSRLRDMAIRRAKREPLQYILGHAYFMGHKIMVDESVLIPRPETELLVDEALKSIPLDKSELNLLDIGSGSGCISIALADQLPNSMITAVDVDGAAVELAKKNAENLNIKNINFVRLDILNSYPKEVQFDVILSNPPYVSTGELKTLQPEVLNYEPRGALTDGGDGLIFFRRYAEIFHELLTDKGRFFLEIGFGQSGEILKIFEEKGYRVEIKKDYSKIPRMLCGEKIS